MIGNYTFDDCTGITSIYAYPTTSVDLSLRVSVFENVNKTTCTLYVPTGSKTAYQAAAQWKDFTNIVEMTTAVPTLSDAKVNLYPNPMSESFQISGIVGTSTLSVLDLNGKTIFSKQVVENENISVGTLPKGVYIAKLITNNGTIERKIVKE